MGELTGKIAVVTGASAGIGKATAEALARAGASVVLADRDAARGESAAEAIRSQGGEATFVSVDVTDPAQVAAMVATAIAAYGGLDVAFNNARGQPSWPEDANWDRYGEIAVGRGLEWGGNWRGFNDRPHIEYHPGLGAGEARAMRR